MKRLSKILAFIIVFLLLLAIDFKVYLIQTEITTNNKVWKEYYKAEDYYYSVETLLDSIAIWYPTFMDTYSEGDTYDKYLETREKLNF